MYSFICAVVVFDDERCRQSDGEGGDDYFYLFSLNFFHLGSFEPCTSSTVQESLNQNEAQCVIHTVYLKEIRPLIFVTTTLR